MIHPKHHHNFAVVILLGVILLFVLLGFSINNPRLLQTNQNNIVNPASDNLSRYTSDFLHISILKPEGFTVKERFGVINLKNSEGEIAIGMTGTNFNSLDKYLDYHTSMNNIIVSDEKMILLDGYDSVSRIDNVGDRMIKVYYIFPEDGTVFTISTAHKDLYDELDQVAQSFKYTP